MSDFVKSVFKIAKPENYVLCTLRKNDPVAYCDPLNVLCDNPSALKEALTDGAQHVQHREYIFAMTKIENDENMWSFAGTRKVSCDLRTDPFSGHGVLCCTIEAYEPHSKYVGNAKIQAPPEVSGKHDVHLEKYLRDMRVVG